MDIPSLVLIHNQTLGLKGTQGKLFQISEHGYYEVECAFGQARHRVLLPIQDTVIISKDQAEEEEPQIEIER